MSRFPLVHASADEVPLPDQSFDIVLSDHGAMSWADPYHTVPEAARLLRAGGLLVFNMTSPLRAICGEDPSTSQPTNCLEAYYFSLSKFESRDDGGVDFQLPYGEWIRLLRANGFTVEDLIELRPTPNATTTYDLAPISWARRWPAENIWRATCTH